MDDYPYKDGERREFESRYEAEENFKAMFKATTVLGLIIFAIYLVVNIGG